RRGASRQHHGFVLTWITMAVSRIITGDLRHGHAVTVRAIQVWYRTVGLVMEDAQLQAGEPCRTAPPDLGRVSQLMVHRSQDWVKSTAGRLSSLLKKIISCSSAHQHWRPLTGGVCGLLLEALVGAVNDEEPRVRKRCEVVLREVSQRNQSRSSAQTFTDILSENLHSLATSLPRLMRTSDDQKKLFVLNVFLGYLKVLGSQVSVVLNSAAHLQRISKALMQVLELDVMDVRIVEERSYAATIETSSDSYHPYAARIQRRHFLYFTDEKIFSLLMEICRTLDHFLDLYQQSSAYRKQAAMVLNEIVRARQESACQQKLRSSSTINLRPPQLNSNIWQLCIQTGRHRLLRSGNGAGLSALFDDITVPSTEKAGEETLLRLSQHPQAPRVLTVMLTHSDCSLLPLVGDIVQDVLMALDLSYQHTAALFCSVLHALLKALARWFPSNSSRTSNSVGPKQNPPHEELFNIRQFMLDQQKEKELAEGIGIEDDLEDLNENPPPLECEDVDDIGGPDVKAELPLHLSVTKDIMERCIHLLSDPSLRLRLKVLDVLELCVCVLSEKENELLPMAHRCWPPLLQRLTADDPLAVLRAFRVLCTLGETCGDFLRRRVSKEVLPKLSSSLLRQAPTSAKAGPVYTHTLNYKLQLAVLQGLGSLCQRLSLGDAELDAVCEACLPYLSCRQPIRLQEAAIGMSRFQHLIQVDPDGFWFTLNELHCPSSYIPPHPDLHPIQLSGMGRARDEFSDNALRLLREEFGSAAETEEQPVS
ncbi:hypothetical protein KUCAC02_012207, partial [Chaenocephalus aceratus]